MEPARIPKVPKVEYDALIRRQFMSRIAFCGGEHPYVAPFVYVFDGRYLSFLPSRYGRKMEYFRDNPRVSVEIEEYAPDLSSFAFVSLRGTLEEVTDPAQKEAVRDRFVTLIRERDLSSRVLTAFGLSADDPPAALVRDDRSLVWRLVNVEEIVALKNG